MEKISNDILQLNFNEMNPSEEIVLAGKYNNSMEYNLTISYKEENYKTITV